MRMIPKTIVGSIASDAERRAFALLSTTQLDAAARCFHSLNISEHDYKLVAEIDFAVLSAKGLLVLEVKGGGVSVHEGVWQFRDRFGRLHRRSEGPFEQARSAMFSLRDRLVQEVGREVVESLTVGYGVVFPDCPFRERSVEWADQMILDVDGIRGKQHIGSYVETLFQYWREKKSPTRRDVDPGIVDRVAQALRPEFEKVPSLRHRADQIDLAMERLTEEQYSRLDVIETCPRIICSGGAGTGKTFIAAEIARRHAATGHQVLVACPSLPLAAFLRSRISSGKVSVAALEGLSELQGQFDTLIVDEGQDLLNFETLDRLDRRLRGGLADGTWRLFYDANKQTGLLGRFEPQALEFLKSHGAVPATLRLNCRNTRQIATHTKLLTAADLGTPVAGDGPQVLIEYFENETDEAALVDAQLARLIEQGVPRGEITILSALQLGASCSRLTRAHARRRLAVLDEQLAGDWPVAETTFATIADFKGLENRFILLVDVHALDDTDRDVNLLYVAMSRARAGLWMAVHGRLRKRIDEIARANVDRVLRDIGLSYPSQG